MADFCTQCHLEMFPALGPGHKYDFEDMTSLTDVRHGLYALALCEGCGLTQVAPDGSCTGNCMNKEHGSVAQYLDLINKVMEQPDLDPEARKRLKMKKFALIFGFSSFEFICNFTENEEKHVAAVQDLQEGSQQPGGPAI
jgi:hypothetical protein